VILFLESEDIGSLNNGADIRLSRPTSVFSIDVLRSAMACFTLFVIIGRLAISELIEEKVFPNLVHKAHLCQPNDISANRFVP
jgi:hypothetical protein